MGRSITYLLRGRGPEQQLVDGLVRGEAASYRQLYEAFSPRLRRILWRIHRDPQLVEDALQITFLQVFRCVPQFNGQSSLLTWMAQIALNESRRMARRQTRSRQIEKEGIEEAEGPSSPEHHSAAREEYACLAAAVDALPLVPRPSDSDRLPRTQSRAGNSSTGTRTIRLRAWRGVRRTSPCRSSVKIMLCTVGGVT